MFKLKYIKYLGSFLLISVILYGIIENIIGYSSLYKYSDILLCDKYSSIESSYSNIKNIVSEPFILIHAVYSIEKLKKYYNKYKGFETDIVFYENKFILAHDNYNIDINKNNYVYLDDIFANINIVTGGGKSDLKYIWLDMKNMDNENYLYILEILINLTINYNINKSYIIIESPYPALLQSFSKKGFITSYYFEPIFYADKEQNNLIIKNIIDIVEKYPVDFISCNVKYFSLVNTVFPNMYKNYWYSGSSIQMILRSLFIRYYILNKDTTGILILDY